MDTKELQVQTCLRGKEIVVRLEGELDVHSANELSSAVDSEIQKHPDYGGMVFDFSGLNYLNSQGIGVIVGYSKELKQKGKALVIRKPSEGVNNILNAVGMNKIINIYLY